MAETRMQEWAEELATLAQEEHGPNPYVVPSPPKVILNSEQISRGERAWVPKHHPLGDLLPTFRADRGGIRFTVISE